MNMDRASILSATLAKEMVALRRSIRKLEQRMEQIEKKLFGKKPSGSPYDASQGGAKAIKG